MKKQVILHAGFTKTASTTIQHTLGQNRKALANAGLSYAHFSLKDRDRPNHSIPFNYIFAEEPPRHIVHVTESPFRQVERLKYLEEFETALTSRDTVMFSAESVSVFSHAVLETMRDAFERHGCEVRVVSIVRPVLSYMTSLTQHHVKSGSPLSVPYDRLPSKAIGRIESVFPNAEFYSFKDSLKHPGGPTNFLLEKLGFRVNLTEVSPTNLSWSDNAVHLAGFINRFAPTLHHGDLNRLRQHGDIHSIAAIGGPRFTLTASDIDREILQKEITWLERRFGDDFHEDLDSLPTEQKEWAPDQVSEAIRAIRKLPLALTPLAAAYFQAEARMQDPKGATLITKSIERRMFRRQVPSIENTAAKKTSA